MAYVVRGTKDVENFPVEKCHGGEGTIFVKQLLGYEPQLPVPGNPDDFDSLINFMHETTLPAGTTIGRHPQIGNEEIYYVIEGRGEMKVDEDTFVMEAGTACLTKSGSYHQFRNIGDKDLRIIVIEAVFDKANKNHKK